MEIALSWDLIIIIFFSIVTAYSFIVGKDEAVKIIIASYIAIVAVQAIANILEVVFVQAGTMMGMFGFSLDAHILAITKLVLFVAMIIIIAIRGGFEMQYAKQIEGVWDTLLTGAFGFTTAGLLLTALLTYIAARPLLDRALSTAPLLLPLLKQSKLVEMMIHYQDLWFCLPALLLLGVGIFSRKEA